MRIALLGIGALGSLFASKLSAVAEVAMLGHWPEQIEAVTQNGLTLIETDGQETARQVTIGSDPETIGRATIVLVLVKSHQTAAAAVLAGQLLDDDGLAVTLQNGLGNLEILQGTLGAHRVTLGVTSEGATMVGPGTVRHAGTGTTVLGQSARLGNAQTGRLKALAELLAASGLRATVATGTDGLLWGKLAISAAINPLTALLRVPNGSLLDHPTLLAVMNAAADEVAAVAAARGIVLPYADAAAQARHVAAITAGNRSSMLQDIERGAQTEIEAICGEVVLSGSALGVPVPVNQWLLRLVHEEERGEGLISSPADIDALLGTIINKTE